MALVVQAFNSTVYNIGSGAIDIDGDTYRVMLLAGYVFNAAHQNILQVISYQIDEEGGYVGGGILIDDTGWISAAGEARLEGANVVFTATGDVPDFDSFVVYAETSGKLLLHADFGEIVSLQNADQLIVNIPASGLINFGWLA